MTNPIGPLLAADESLCHQMTDTFAIVGTSDRSWTEKVCAMAAARDGSLQLAFGLGKYPNRGVLDGYAGLSRGVEQMTVRASRRLSNDPELAAVGPVRYEVVEPMRSVRFSLQPNEHRPLAFEWLFEAAVPAQLEDRTHLRDGYRTSADLVRYHQIGVASGWVEIAGERTELGSASWVSTRDHSWGIRYDVGSPPTDIEQIDHQEIAGLGALYADRAGEKMHDRQIDIAHVIGGIVVLNEAAGPVVGLDDEVVAGIDPRDHRNFRMPAVMYHVVVVGRLRKIDLDQCIWHQ